MSSQRDGLLEVRILSRRPQAADIIELELVAKDGGDLPAFEAGAHVDIHIRPGLVRQYSICSDPRQRQRYRLGILLDPNTRGGSQAIHSDFAPGQHVLIGAPRCNFHLTQGTGPVLLLAAGIGITPLLSMAQVLAAQSRPFVLHYCTRSRARTAFLEEVTAGPLACACRLHHDDGPEAQRFSLSQALGSASASADVYICGPEGFIEFVLRGAAQQGVDPARLHVERFKASDAQEGQSFTVVAAHSGVELEVPPGVSVASALIGAGINLPISCEQGICGTCLTPVLEGTPDHRDQYQTDEEKAANTQMTPCCSRSLSRRIVLAL